MIQGDLEKMEWPKKDNLSAIPAHMEYRMKKCI